MMEWKNIKWKPIEFYVFKLQKKIYQASKKQLLHGHCHKIKTANDRKLM